MKNFLSFLLFLIIACNTSLDNDNSKEISTIRYPHKYLGAKFKIKAFEAINSGDTLLYNQVAKSYILSKNPEDLLFFANIMALKYNYSEAYYHIYYITHFFCNENDTAFANYMLYNLAKVKETRNINFSNKIIGPYNISDDNLKSPSYYLDELKDPVPSSSEATIE